MTEEIKQQAEEESTYKKQTWVDHFVDEEGFVVQQGTAMDALHLIIWKTESARLTI